MEITGQQSPFSNLKCSSYLIAIPYLLLAISFFT